MKFCMKKICIFVIATIWSLSPHCSETNPESVKIALGYTKSAQTPFRHTLVMVYTEKSRNTGEMFISRAGPTSLFSSGRSSTYTSTCQCTVGTDSRRNLLCARYGYWDDTGCDPPTELVDKQFVTTINNTTFDEIRSRIIKFANRINSEKKTYPSSPSMHTSQPMGYMNSNCYIFSLLRALEVYDVEPTKPEITPGWDCQKHNEIHFTNPCNAKASLLIRYKNLIGEWETKGRYVLNSGRSRHFIDTIGGSLFLSVGTRLKYLG